MAEMHTKVDTINFTIPCGRKFPSNHPAMIDAVFECVDKALGDVWSPIFRTGSWEFEKGVRQYHTTLVDEQTKVRLSFGNVNEDIQVEVGGVACDHIRSMGIFYEIFQVEAIRFSRIDLACDFECDYSVEDIISKGYKTTFKSSKVERSAQGDTTYVGSRKSERMLRVYRYHPPHPRHKLLRCEVEIKGRTAKAIARGITAESCADMAHSALKAFGLAHPMIATAIAQASKLPAHGYDKSGKGRMRWLLTQVAPALAKAHSEGDIDVHDFVSRYVLPLVK